MTAYELVEIIKQRYNIRPACLSDGSYASIFYHPNSGKIFALLLFMPQNYLGIKGKREISVVNFRSTRIDTFIGKPGFYPAYAMNKKRWISINLCEFADSTEVIDLLEMSFNLAGQECDK